MRPDQRWFPTNINERAAWFKGFSRNFANIAADFGFPPDEVDAVNADNDVVQFLARTILATKAYTAAVISFQQTVLLGDIGETTPEFPAQPVVTTPVITPTGIFERLEKNVRRIRVHPAYTETTGALLGIIPRQPTRVQLADHEPKFKVTAAADPYTFDIKVTRGGFDGFAVEISRNASETWESAGSFVRSPARVELKPTAAGQPELIQVRVRMKIGNDAVGNHSDIQTVTLTP